MEKRIKDKIKSCDKMIIFIFIMIVLVRLITLGYISHIHETSQADIESVIQLYEANPMAKLYLNLAGIYKILLSMIFPAFGFAVYYYFRSLAIAGKFDVKELRFFVTFCFFFMLLNVVNDVAVFAGAMIK